MYSGARHLQGSLATSDTVDPPGFQMKLRVATMPSGHQRNKTRRYGLISYRMLSGSSKGSRRTELNPASKHSSRTFLG